MVPAATGTDTAGSLRIPSALCGTSTIKPTRGLVSLRGVVPLATSLDHAGPMARTLEDCALLLAAMAGPIRAPGARSPRRPRLRRAGPGRSRACASRSRRASTAARSTPTSRTASMPRSRTARALGAELVEPPPPRVALDVGDDFLDVLYAELLAYHRRFDGRRDALPAVAARVGRAGARRATSPPSATSRAQAAPPRDDRGLAWWLADYRISALLEPTVPCVAPAARRRLRPRRQRLRADLAHALLGLDGLPGRRAARRGSARAAACRSASR